MGERQCRTVVGRNAQSFLAGGRRPLRGRCRIDRSPTDQDSHQTIEGLAAELHRRVRIDRPSAKATDNAQRSFGSFKVAAKPEKAVRGAAWKVSQQTRNARA